MDNLVQICLDEQVDFLLIAGDLFDTDRRDFNAALSAAAQLQKLNRAGIPVYLILGNHDSLDEMTRQVPWPGQCHAVRPPPAANRSARVAAGRRAWHELCQTRGDEKPRSRLSASGARLFNIGLLHTNAGGNRNHDTYAPCAVEELVAKGYDYWALGHVHDYQVLHQRPHVVYCGNTQGRHARELGAKGCVLVGVENGELTSLEFRETDVLRWYRETITLEPGDDEDALLDRTRAALDRIAQSAAGRLAAVRLSYAGTLGHPRASDARRHAAANRCQHSRIGPPTWAKTSGSKKSSSIPARCSTSTRCVKGKT